MASTPLPALRRSSRIASQGGWNTAQEIASYVESSVKKLAALEPADIKKMNLFGRWETLGQMEHCWLVHMLSADGYQLVDDVFYDYFYYCQALYWESPQLLQPAAEKLKDLLMSAQPAAVLPEKIAGATYSPPPVYHSPPETVVAEEEESWLQYSARQAQEAVPDDSEDDCPDFCRGCDCPLETYEHTYCYGCVEGMDEKWKEEKMENKERCTNCCCHFSTAPSGRIVCGCDEY
jgi:hypothetical protein